MRVDVNTLETALRASGLEGIGSQDSLRSDPSSAGGGATSRNDMYNACQRCKNPAETFKMVCPHCLQLMCQKCASEDINMYLPQLHMGFSRYEELLKSVSEEVDKHVRAEQLKIDKYYEDRKREAKNQLVTGANLLNLHKKMEATQELLKDMEVLSLETGLKPPSEGEAPIIDQEFQAACNLVLRAEKVRKSQMTDHNLDFSEATIALDHFDERGITKNDKFIKRPVAFSLDSSLNREDKQAFEELFSMPAKSKYRRQLSLQQSTGRQRVSRNSTRTSNKDLSSSFNAVSSQSVTHGSPFGGFGNKNYGFRRASTRSTTGFNKGFNNI